MAIVLILACSCLGFTSAVAAVFLFDVSLLHAFGLWMSAGFASLLLAVVPALLPRRASYAESPSESA